MQLLKIRIGNKIIRVKDCKGLASLRGLMFDSMKGYDGALIYANSIWMPFVKYELDLIFLDKDFRIIGIRNAVPLTFNPDTWRIYKNEKARYCLEIKAGIARNLKALIGKKIKRVRSLVAMTSP